MVIDAGRLVFDGNLEALHSLGDARRTLVVDLVEPAPTLEVPNARTIKVEGPRQWLVFPAEASAAPLVAHIAATHQVADLAILEPNIEDVIKRIYRTGRGSGRV